MSAPDHAARRAALVAALPEVDALLVTDLVNVGYLTGFTGSNAALLVPRAGEPLLVTDFRYRTQVATEVPDLPVLIDRASAIAAATVAAGRGARVLGFESHVVSVDEHGVLRDAAAPAELAPVSGLVERLRLVKDDAEVALLRTACAVADAALAQLIAAGGVAAGRTERAVAHDLEHRMRTLGADGPAFATILAAGEHSAIPHHRPTDRELRAGDLVKIDFGALVEGYHSDTTRTVVLGPAADWQRDLHTLVARAQAAGCAAALPGVPVRAVDAAARDVIAAAGHADDFGHGLGHGIGLRIHEAPWLGQRGVGELAAGMAITVEPGVYLEGRGGVRIEDSLVVRADGPESLTHAPRELLEL